MNEEIDITVIIPTLDEEETIEECITTINSIFVAEGLKGEIIVSDSSTDRTADIANTLGAKVIHPSKKGYGAAYLTALPHARGKYIVMADGDGTYDFSEIPKFLMALDAGADMVIGSRFLGTILPGAMAPLHRYIGNPLLTRMVNVLFKSHFSDVHSGFRALKRSALERLTLSTVGMEFATEMIIQAWRAGLTITEIPIIYRPRRSPSKLHSFADGWRHVRFVLLVNPYPFIAIPGLIFSGIGFLFMTLFALRGDVTSSHLHSFILGAFLLCGGFQVLVTGILFKTYAVVNGFEQRSGIIKKIMDYHNLEMLLFAGGIIFLLGLILGLDLIVSWIKSGFGPLTEVVKATTALTLGTIGLQIIIFGIFISILMLRDNGNETGPFG
jgi:glycosyltransferase involved in cell wall biosynthesis